MAIPNHDGFAVLLTEQLNRLGTTLLHKHLQETETLRAELEDARRRADQDDPRGWRVPEEPAPRSHCLAPHGGPRSAPLEASPRHDCDSGCFVNLAFGMPMAMEARYLSDHQSLEVSEDDSAAHLQERHEHELEVLTRASDSQKFRIDAEERQHAELQQRPDTWQHGPAGRHVHLQYHVPEQDGQQMVDETLADVSGAPEVSACSAALGSVSSVSEAEAAKADPMQARFVARDVWSRSSAVRKRRVSFGGYLKVSTDFRLDAVRQADHPCVRAVMLRPTSKVRVLWLMATLIFLSYDIVIVPLDVFFDLMESSWLSTMKRLNLAFWACDLLMNFITGFFQKNGVLEMRPWPVAVTYSRKWLPLDVLLILSDCIVLYLLSYGDLQAVTMLHAVKWLRVLRIVRLARFSRKFNDLALFFPERVLVCLRSLKTALSFAAIIHLLACMWYSVGHVEMMRQLSGDGLAEQDVTALHRYAYSVRWSVAQLHGVSEAPLTTVTGMLLGISSGVLGFVVLAVCISKVGSTQESAATEEHKAQMRRLCRHYLRKRNLSAVLKMRLRRYLGENETSYSLMRLDILPRRYGGMNLRERVEHEDSIVNRLPNILQAYLYEEMRRPLLEMQPLFEDLNVSHKGSPLMREICHHAISCEVALAQELVFSSGDVCNKTLISDVGHLVYVHQVLRDQTFVTVESTHTMSLQAVTPTSFEDEEILVERGRHISEAALWTNWEHCGTLLAHENCTMLAMDVALFARAICNHDTAHLTARRYSVFLIAWMNSIGDEEVFSDLLQVPRNIFTAQQQTNHINFTDHLIFISHYKKEAGTEATLLEEGFQRLIQKDPLHPANDFRRPVFLDTMDLMNLSRLERYVCRSHNLIILLTPGILTRPWCLLEIVTALRNGTEILPVEVVRRDLSFAYPDDNFFKDLVEGKVLPPSDEALLKSRGVELHELQVVKKVFDKIALSFSPHKSEKIREAELMDILRRCMVQEKRTSSRKPTKCSVSTCAD